MQKSAFKQSLLVKHLEDTTFGWNATGSIRVRHTERSRRESAGGEQL